MNTQYRKNLKALMEKSKEYTDNIYALATNNIAGTDTSINILAKTSNQGVWVGSDTGHWYYWDGTQYVDGGLYLSTAPYNILNKFLDISEITWLTGHYINTSVGVGNVVDLTPVENSAIDYYIQNCNEGDTFIINGVGGGNNRLWCFVNEDNKVLEVANANTNAEHSNLVLVAPKMAKKLILNSFNWQHADTSYYSGNVSKINFDYSNVDTLNKFSIKDINFTTGINYRIYNVLGYKVVLTPNDSPNYSSAIIKCSEGDKFIISGYAYISGNFPVYSFIDANNTLLERGTQSTYKNQLLTAPKDADRLILNIDTNTLKSGFNKMMLLSTNETNNNLKTYSIVKKPTSDLIISDFVNGVKMGEDLENHLADFKKTGDLFVHVPTFKILNGKIFVTYYANTRSASENPEQMTARFCYADMNDLTNITFIDIQDVGDTYDSKNVDAIYDTILMEKDGIIYIMWTAKLNGEYYRLYQTYTISTGVFGNIEYNTFEVNGTSLTMNITNIETLLENNNIEHNRLYSDIGIMQKITTRVENNVTYYYTGLYSGDFNCVVKSSDFINWIYVTKPEYNYYTRFENAVFVDGDVLYYFQRLYENYSFGLLSTYNLSTKVWTYPYYINDCQSRSDFIKYNNKLYLIHAPYDRNHIGILEVNNLDNAKEVQTAKVPYYFYPYVDIYNSELYMIFTASYNHIYLSKFDINYVDDTTIKNVVNTLFN